MSGRVGLSIFLLLAAGCQYVTGLEDLEIVASSQGAGPQGGAPSGASGAGEPAGAGGQGGQGGVGGAASGGAGGEGGEPSVTTTIHNGSVEPLSLAQNELTLFFSDSAGTIWEWPKTGLLGPQTLIENEISPQNLWATNTELYWSAGTSSEEVVRGTIADLATTRSVLASGSNISHIQTDPLGAVFYADSVGVHNVTTAVTLHIGTTYRIDVRDETRIFMLNPELNVFPKAGGAVTPLLSGVFGYAGIASDATSVFAIDGVNATIARVDKDDGDQFDPLVTPMAVGRDIAVDYDTDDVYFTASLMVGRTSKTGGAITTVATGSSPQRLLVDDENIYWLDSGTDDVMRTTR